MKNISTIIILLILLTVPEMGAAGLKISDSTKIIHVMVALCDNQYQGIVPVSEELGDGRDPNNNLYWGAMYGVETYFKNTADWDLVQSDFTVAEDSILLDQCLFKHNEQDILLLAQAYNGKYIKKAVEDFVEAVKSIKTDSLTVVIDSQMVKMYIHSAADLIVYVGHNGLMDCSIEISSSESTAKSKDGIILCCAAKSYFSELFAKHEFNPILWTTNLMAPEAYTLKAAIDGWIIGENSDQIRERAAEAYAHYQKCSLNAARRLFVSGWK